MAKAKAGSKRRAAVNRKGYELPPIPSGWKALAEETRKPYFSRLREFLDEDARTHEILPPAPDVFHALELTPLRDVRVLLLGQDPYPTPGNAHGLSFSVRPGVRIPASLRNMHKELASDLGIPAPSHGSLEAWASQGVLLLNAVLTVRAGEPNSHRGQGWETFTDEIIRKVNAKRTRVVFALWGSWAQKKAALIDADRHAILKTAHPSPLSARRGFLGSRVYSAINEQLGARAIDWSL